MNLEAFHVTARTLPLPLLLLVCVNIRKKQCMCVCVCIESYTLIHTCMHICVHKFFFFFEDVTGCSSMCQNISNHLNFCQGYPMMEPRFRKLIGKKQFLEPNLPNKVLRHHANLSGPRSQKRGFPLQGLASI